MWKGFVKGDVRSEKGKDSENYPALHLLVRASILFSRGSTFRAYFMFKGSTI